MVISVVVAAGQRMQNFRPEHMKRMVELQRVDRSMCIGGQHLCVGIPAIRPYRIVWKRKERKDCVASNGICRARVVNCNSVAAGTEVQKSALCHGRNREMSFLSRFDILSFKRT